jgi:hypothetical protein
VEASLAAIRVKGSRFGALYRRICRRAGHKVAIVAVAHAILEIAWHLLTKATTYQELGADYLDRRDKQHTVQHYVRLLERLGHRVLLEPAPIAA